MTLTYARAEVRRAFRNRRFFLFAVGFPLAIYLLVATPNRGVHDLDGSGISAPLYFMAGLATLGTMNSVLGGGARISIERTIGWTRHLRATPLRPRTYFATKVVTGYLTALVPLAALYSAGISLGVDLSVSQWAGMTALMLVGLLPFAALGVMLGHLVGVDALGPAIGGTSGLLSFLGGAWFPVASGFMHDVAQALPSYGRRLPAGAQGAAGGAMIRVLIAEDQAMVRGALASLLGLEEDIEVVAEVERGDRVMRAARSTRPDVALIDIEMPGLDGISVASELRRELPDVRVVIVTTFGRPGYLRHALDQGVSGFILKDAPASELAGAVRQVVAGRQVIDASLAAAAIAAGESPLTTRERDVLRAAQSHETTADIAAALYCPREPWGTT